MAKNFICTCYALAIVLLVLQTGCTPSLSQTHNTEVSEIDFEEIEVYQRQEIENQPLNVRKRLQKVYLNEVGVREKTGRNDGKDVAKYLKSVNLGEGYAWCAAFVKWCFDQVGVKTTITAWSPTAHNRNNVVYEKGDWKTAFEPGDVFTLYYSNKKRIGHTGFVNSMLNDNMLETCEGNTNDAGSREGDGVYLKYRPVKTIYTITSWIP